MSAAPKRFWTLLARVFGFSALFIWFGSFYVWYSYFNSSPNQPDFASGHVVPLNNHGSVHYLTSQQDTRITAMQTGAGILFVAGFLITEIIIRPPKAKPWENK
jgi:hypothetical protein